MYIFMYINFLFIKVYFHVYDEPYNFYLYLLGMCVQDNLSDGAMIKICGGGIYLKTRSKRQ